MKKLYLILFVALISTAAFAGPYFSGGGGSSDSVGIYTVLTLPVSATDGTIATITDGADAADCDTGGGAFVNACLYDADGAAWVIVGDGTSAPGSGSMTTVKLGNSQVGDADIVTLDFLSGFFVQESLDTEINVSINTTPDSGSATIEIGTATGSGMAGSVEVKYDSTDFQESTNGLYLGDSPTIPTSILIGSDDATVGTANLYGGGAGADGAVVNLYLGADDDTTISHMIVQIVEDDLTIGPNTDPDALKLDAAKDLYLTDGDVHIQEGGTTRIDLDAANEQILVGTDDTLVGTMVLYGGGAGLDGGVMKLYLGADDDTSIASYDMQISEDDLLIGTNSDTDVLKVAAGSGLEVTAGNITISAGNLIINDTGNIGSESDTDAIAIAADGKTTFTQDMTVNEDIIIGDGKTIGSASATSAMTIASTGIVTFVDDIIIKNTGTIGSAGDADSISIATDGKTTFTQDMTVNEDIIIGDAKYIGSASDVDAIQIEADGDIVLTQDIELGHATDTTIARVSAGVVSIEGNNIYVAGGTDVADADVADDITITAGSQIAGGNPEFTTIELGHASDSTIARTGAGTLTIEGNEIYRAGGTDVPDADVADDITVSNYLPLAGGTLTGEVVVDNLGLEFTEGDDHSDCSAFSATGGGIFYDDSDGKFKKCQDNVLTDLDTDTGGAPALSAVTAPTAAWGISFDDEEKVTWTTSQNTAGSFLTINNSVADVTNQVYLLDLDYSVDDNQANADFIIAQDAGGTVFTLEQNGDITTTGGLDITGATELTLANDETITNAVNGVIKITGILETTGNIELGHASDNTLSAASGVLSIEGNVVHHTGGTDIADADIEDDITITSTKKISTLLTTEQLRLSYDANNYATWTVAADGALTVATVDNAAAEGDINFNPDGLVGVKTAVPSVELDVTGSIKASVDVESATVTFTGSDADPAAAGETRFDSTITGLDTGALAWYDGDEIRILIDLDSSEGTLASGDDGKVVTYNWNAGSGYYNLSTAGAGDVLADGTVPFTGDVTLRQATPDIFFEDSDESNAAAKIGANANDADDVILTISVDDSGGDDQAYIEFDGVTETIDLLQNTTLTGNLSVGATPADAGTGIRMTSNSVIEYRNAANNGNLTAIQVDGSDNLLLGDGNTNAVTITPATTVTGALTADGGITMANAGVITFTDAVATTITHVDNTGLLINLELEVDGTLDADGVVALGDGGDNFSVASDGIDIDVSGNITNAGTISSGAITATDTSTFGTAASPDAADGATLGSATAEWSDAYFADGAVIYLGSDQEIPLTHVADTGLRFDDEDALIFGANSNWTILYDEDVDDQLLIATTGTAATATTDPLLEILVGTTPTADQQVFGIAKGTQASNTPLLTLDEDGDMTIAGSFTSASLDGSNAITMTNNTSITPSGNQLYFEGNELKISENGAEEVVLTQEDGATLTGTTWSFAGVTNMVLPTTAADASGEISVSTGEQLKWHDGTKVITIDTTPTDDNYVLKYDNATATFTLEADATGGTPAWNDVTAPTADVNLIHDAGEETQFTYTGNFTTGAQFNIEQLTGNPSGGVLLQVKAADSNVTLAQLGDGTNYTQISQTGNLTFAGTATATFANATTLNEDIDINLDAADEEIAIDQTNAAGTEDVPLIAINDDRTGATATELTEATIWIDAEGVYAFAAVDGAAYAEGGFVVADTGNIGSVSDTDSIAIDATGNVTFSQNVVISGTGIELNHATANTLTASGGVLSIEGNVVHHTGGTDITDADIADALTVDMAAGSSAYNSAADVALGAAGEYHLNTTDEQLSFHSAADGEISGEVALSLLEHIVLTFDPSWAYDQETTYRVIPIMYVGDDFVEGITITEWKVAYVGGDPTTELDADIVCDTTPDYNPAAGATVMDVIDTTAGASTADTGFDSATCANGSIMYVRFGADPTDANVLVTLDIWGYAEED